jgi:hypothetical protein
MKRTIIFMLDEAAATWPAAPYALPMSDAGSKTVNPRNVATLRTMFKLA